MKQQRFDIIVEKKGSGPYSHFSQLKVWLAQWTVTQSTTITPLGSRSGHLNHRRSCPAEPSVRMDLAQPHGGDPWSVTYILKTYILKACIWDRKW